MATTLIAAYRGYVGTYGLPRTPEEAAAAADAILADTDMSGYEDLVEPVREALVSALEGGGEEMLARLRVAMDEALINQVHERALAYAEDRAAELVGMTWVDDKLVPNPDAAMAITDTTRDRLREMVLTALRPGEGYDLEQAVEDLRDEVTGSPLFSRDRAQLIARAELGIAHNAGALSGLNDAAALGLQVKKAWSTAKDDKVCLEQCLPNELAGPLPLDALFPSGHMAPLAHPRCRCALIGVVT